MSTTAFDLPPNPTPGQIATLPSGDQLEYNGYAWEPVTPAPLHYPISIDKGGTNATTAAQARINLGIGGTEPFKLFDGTQAAPGLAWVNEPGLGFWRSGAGEVKLAQGGTTLWGITAAGNDTYSAQYAKAASGKSVVSIVNAPIAGADYLQMDIGIDQTMGNISLRPVGTFTAKPFRFTNASIYTFDNSLVADFGISVNGRAGNAAQLWLNKGVSTNENVIGAQNNGVNLYRMILGDATAAGTLHWQRYNDAGVYAGTFMQVNRQNGLVTFGDTGGIAVQGALSVAGAANVTGGVAAANYFLHGTGYGMTQDATWRYLQFQAGYYFNWHIPTGNLYWSPGAGAASLWNASGDFQAGRNIAAAGSVSTFLSSGWSFITNSHQGMIFNGGQIRQFIAQGNPGIGVQYTAEIYHEPGISAGCRFICGGPQYQFRNDGNAYCDGGWHPFSDARLKTDLMPITDAMQKLRGVTGYTFERADELVDYHGETPTRAGLVAQEVQVALPEAALDTGGDEHLLAVDSMGVIALLVNALHEVDARLSQLETA